MSAASIPSPADMSTGDIRAELRHDLSVYERVQHPVSKAAMARRIEMLVAEMDRRALDGETD